MFAAAGKWKFEQMKRVELPARLVVGGHEELFAVSDADMLSDIANMKYFLALYGVNDMDISALSAKPKRTPAYYGAGVN